MSPGDLVKYVYTEFGGSKAVMLGILLSEYSWNGVPWAKVYVSGEFHKYPMSGLKRVNAPNRKNQDSLLQG